ncbi:Uncharacterized protein family Ycf36 [Cynara cardunculus var. scolymus]|uniref:Uncharacterized protein family Ycf36 n=1 Tax=Cynara cardunculus var. scolymus TaxID=59895 RepID=A0A103Y556_CYNCS|nr:Uncharacterized protein family Ycf36 [Cynara cardunculus var. scolymus]
MIRLNVYCSLLSCPSQKVKDHRRISPFNARKWNPGSSQRFITSMALKDEMDGRFSNLPGQSWEPGLEIEVPFEQRPVNEYSSLKEGPLYSWGELRPQSFFLRLGGLWLVTFTVLGLPISAASFNPSHDPLRFLLAAGTGTLFLVSLVVLRIYLILARDRLLGSYKVKPVIKLLKQTLVGTGALLVTAVSLIIFATPVEDFIQNTFAMKGNVVATKSGVNMSKEELLSLPLGVKADDDLAAAAAEAADGRPVYCRDRYYRALAGGQYCKWEDLLK